MPVQMFERVETQLKTTIIFLYQIATSVMHMDSFGVTSIKTHDGLQLVYCDCDTKWAVMASTQHFFGWCTGFSRFHIY